MDVKTLNEHQHAAYKLVKKEYNWIVGGLENALTDYEKESEGYQTAVEAFNDPESIVETVYFSVMSNRGLPVYAKHIRFAGTEFIKSCIRELLVKDKHLKAV